MATIGVPKRYEDGEWRRPWVPQVGDIRPDGLEFHGIRWCPASDIGESQRALGSEYRIPADYIPPSGWRCLEWDEVTRDGDLYTHCGGRLLVYTDRVFGNVGNTVREATSGGRGGYIIRRIEPCKSDAEGVTEVGTPVDASASESAIKNDAQPATAPVAWSFKKQPIPQKVERVLLRHLEDTIEATDEVINDCMPGEVYKYKSPSKHTGQLFNEALHVMHVRPRPLPQTWTIDTIPDGRCFEADGYTNLYWKHGGKIGTLSREDGYLDPDCGSSFATITPTEYVAVLEPVQ